MAIYTLIPSDGTLVINNQAAFGVDYDGIDPDIHAVSWYDVEGSVEYIGNPITGEKPQNTIITDITPYLSYITQAQNIINANSNPQLFYASEDGAQFEGEVYGLGQVLSYGKYPPLPGPPEGFTTVPAITASGQDVYLQWTGTGWVAAAFPYNLSLTDAKSYMNSLVNASAAGLINNQLRAYTVQDLLSAPDIGDLVPTDSVLNGYPSVTLYTAAVDAEKLPLFSTIAAATIIEQLYDLSPAVPEPPNYTP